MIGLRRTAFLVGLLAAILVYGSGCAIAHVYAPATGRVLEKETGQPIAGAAVVAEYRTVVVSLGGEVPGCGAMSETKTDENGRYIFKRKLVIRPSLPITWFEEEPALHVFHPGHKYAMVWRRFIGPGPETGVTGERSQDGGWVFFLPRTNRSERLHNNISAATSLRCPRSMAPHYFQLLDQERKACEGTHLRRAALQPSQKAIGLP